MGQVGDKKQIVEVKFLGCKLNNMIQLELEETIKLQTIG